MISSSVMTALTVGVIITAAAPVIAAIILLAARKISPAAFFSGFGAFAISQLVLRIPIMTLLSAQPWYTAFSVTVIGSLVICFTAGLFEESARLIFVRFVLKNHRSYNDSIGFGLGHGFCEMISLCGLGYISYLMLAAIYNGGSLEEYLGMSMPQEQTDLVISSITSLTAPLIRMGILERISALMFHITASTVIFKGVRSGHSVRNWLIAIGLHTALNFITVMLASYLNNIYIIEAVMLVLCSAGLVWTIKQRRSFNSTDAIREAEKTPDPFLQTIENSKTSDQ